MDRLFCFIVVVSLALAGCANQNSPEQLSSQAETHTAAGKYKKALNLYNEAIMTSDKDSALFAKRAGVETLLMDYESALTDYNRAIELRNDVGWYHSKRALVLGELHQPGEAIRSADRALELDPHDVQTLAYRANAYAQEGQYEKALKDALQAQHGGDLVYTYRVLATCYIHLGEPDEALDAIRKGIDLSSEEPGLLCLKAESEMLKLDLKHAIQTAQRAQEKNPDAMGPYSCLARAYLMSGDFNKAKENIDKVSQYSPVDGQALLTVYYMATDDLVKATESALHVVKERSSPESQMTLAEVYTLSGNGEEALGICNGLEREYPDLASVYRAKALALLGLGRYKEAKASATKSIERLTYNPIGYRLRAEAESRSGEEKAAQIDLDFARKFGYSNNLPQEKILVSLQQRLAKQQGSTL